MSRLKQTGAFAMLLLGLSIAGCADDDPDPKPVSDGSAPLGDASLQTDGGRDGGMDASTPDATTPGNDSSTPSVLASCVERPTDLPRPPAGRLTCDLLPPGLTLPR
jgi:hypothetical protein